MLLFGGVERITFIIQVTMTGGGKDKNNNSQHCASTAAPPITTSEGASAGSLNFGITNSEDGMEGGEEEGEPCPKVSSANNKRNNKNKVDGPLMAQRSSPYAKPQGEIIIICHYYALAGGLQCHCYFFGGRGLMRVGGQLVPSWNCRHTLLCSRSFSTHHLITQYSAAAFATAAIIS